MRMPLPAAALVVLLGPAAAGAADLPYPVDPLEPAAVAALGASAVVPPQTVLGPNLVLAPVPGVRVGGAFVYARGLNGPDGPPVYPLLPFAFGYGY